MSEFFRKNNCILICAYPKVVLLLVLIGGVEMSFSAEQTTVERVDLVQYTGLWYEFARLPNSFQKKCAHSTTANYELRPDGKIDVLNRCKKADGKVAVAKGIARRPDNNKQGKLQVSFVAFFGWRLFWGDYWIIGLADDYRYAIVGSPSKKYLWVLSREPNLNSSDWQHIQSILEKYKYPVEKLIVSGKISKI
mgnify:CR=1 FL=1